ncbi:MAG: ThiF family adenylyltransferase, partial [Methanobacterium sp.]
ADWRLWWNVTRAVSWINDANTNNLAVDGHPFELPQFNDSLPYCVFSEDNETFKEWKKVQNKYGIVELDLNNMYCITREFKTPEGKEIHNVEWGECLFRNFKNPITAMWIMLEEVPVINKWQAPNSLKELIDSIEEHSKGLKIGLMDIIKQIVKENSRSLRDGKRHLLLLGFPIPEKIGSENSIIHWQAIKLPVLSHGDKKGFVNGFRDPEDFLWRKDKNHILTPEIDLDWLKSQNWSIQKITNRGQLPKNIISKKTVIIGAGTIGASFAELLVRAGVNKISIIDVDKLEIGNLSRHPLKLKQIEHKKSEEMAFHLNQINPQVQAEFIDKKFNYSKEFMEKMNEYDLIIDCTSENTVLYDLEKFAFKKDKIFVSISIGFGAELLYLSLQKGKQFKSYEFLEKITPWMERDMDKHPEYDLPRDDLKCWNPTFPARYDDILMASSTALKVIEKFIVNNKEESNVVYKKYSANEIIGYLKVE